MTTGGQSIGDRLAAAQHTIVGSDLTKSVLKASTTEIMGPKKKHLDYLHALTSNPNINIVELADTIVERSKNGKWMVVFKALITTHHLMCFGSERFIQHLASRNTLFNLSTFQDKSGVQGYDMSTYVKKYAKYLNQKAISYRVVAYDFTRTKRGKDEGTLKMLTTEDLLKTLPVLQQQVDSLLEFDASANELTNGVINAAFLLLFKDLIRLFACYNDGIINLLEKFFEMKKNQCKDGLELYKKFLTRTSKVSELLKVAEQVGIDKGDIPDLTKAPSSLLDALEQHIMSLEGKKGTAMKPQTKPPENPIADASTALQGFSKETELALKEEAETLNTFNKSVKPQQSEPSTVFVAAATSAPTSTTNPYSSDLTFDLLSDVSTQPWPTTSAAMMSNDISFANFSNPPSSTAMQPWSGSNDIFGSPQTSTNLLQPQPFGQQPIQQISTPANSMPMNGANLEASLANVVANLTVSGQKAPQSFNIPTESKLTGGNNYKVGMAPMTTPVQPLGAQVNPIRQPMYGMPTSFGNPQQSIMPSSMGMTYSGMNNNVMMMPTSQPQPIMMPQMANQVQQPATMRPLNPNNPFGPMMRY